MSPAVARTSGESDLAATERFDAKTNLYFLDTAMGGEYPPAFVDEPPYELMGFRPGEGKLMQARFDWIGITYYGRRIVHEEILSRSRQVLSGVGVGQTTPLQLMRSRSKWRDEDCWREADFRQATSKMNYRLSRSVQAVERKNVLTVELGGWNVTSADVVEVRLKGGQQGGRHMHPCAVLGYILEGIAVLEIEGEEVRTLPAGSAFYEPDGVVVANFGNASQSEPMKFVAFYLKNGEQELIKLLPHESETR
jgi:quercetin dioxygenase-like cupin family protein